MRILVWIIIGILILASILFVIGLIIASSIIRPKRRSLLETSILEEEKFPGIMKFYHEKLEKIYRIDSRYGYRITVYFMRNETPSNKYLIMSHGHTYTHHGCLKYARMMMEYGYNIILYDQRYHGDSGGAFTSLGHYEKYDLYDLVTDTFNRYGNDIELGTYGESMGSSTVLLEAEIDDRIQYVFSDCGFSRLDQLVDQIMSKKHVKCIKPLLCVSKIVFRLLTKIDITRISPIKALHTLQIPIFFAHGSGDDFISSRHTVDMFNSYQGPKHIFIANEEAKHAGSYMMDTKNYEHNIKEFMNENIVKKGDFI